MHGDALGWHFSGLNEIDSSNVGRLKTAWLHEPDNSNEEILSFPVAAGGVLAFCAEEGQILVLDGANGKVKWRTKVVDATDSIVQSNAGCRGLTIDQGVLFFAGAGGRVVAFNLKDGSTRWETRVWARGSRKSTLNGPPLVVKDRLILGTTPASHEHGELIGLDIKTGSEVWRLDLLTAGVAASMPGAYDEKTGVVYWGTGSPSPLFDSAGSSFKTHGVRPGSNLFSAGLLAIDPLSGEIRSWHQEFPHETWVRDSAQSESLLIDRNGSRYLVHPNRSGYVFVYKTDLQFLRVWQASKNINFVKGIDKNTGALRDRKDFNTGSQKGVCPFVEGVFPGLPGAYSPKTGLLYKVAAEWCMDVVLNDPSRLETPIKELELGGAVTPIPPPNERARGHLDARDPLTGIKVWSVDFPEPPLASILATSGNLIFVADGRGNLQALNAGTGRKLWSDTQLSGYAGALMTYEAGGHQYILAVSGWDTRRHAVYGHLFGAPFYSDRPTRAALRAFRLP
jgi:alcohol dehydrogenase (cytochrome c)